MLQAPLLFGARCNDIIERSPAKVIPHPHPSPLPSSTARTFPASWGWHNESAPAACDGSSTSEGSSIWAVHSRDRACSRRVASAASHLASRLQPRRRAIAAHLFSALGGHASLPPPCLALVERSTQRLLCASAVPATARSRKEARCGPSSRSKCASLRSRGSAMLTRMAMGTVRCPRIDCSRAQIRMPRVTLRPHAHRLSPHSRPRGVPSGRSCGCPRDQRMRQRVRRHIRRGALIARKGPHKGHARGHTRATRTATSGLFIPSGPRTWYYR